MYAHTATRPYITESDLPDRCSRWNTLDIDPVLMDTMPKLRTTFIFIAAVAVGTLTAGQTALAKSELVHTLEGGGYVKVTPEKKFDDGTRNFSFEACDKDVDGFRVVGFIYDENGAVYRVQDKNGANDQCGPRKTHRIHADFPSLNVCLYDQSAHGPLKSDRNPFLADCGN